MHNNYFFLKRLIPKISEQITGTTLIDNFVLHNEEIIFQFSNEKEDFFFKTIADGQLGLNTIKSNYAKPKKNFRTWSKDLIGSVVKNVRLFKNERAFLIELGHYQIIFKMFGTRANVILFQGNELIQVLHRKLKTDYEIETSSLDRELDLSLEQFQVLNGDIQKFLPTIGKPILAQLTSKGIKDLPIKEQFQTLNTFLEFSSHEILSIVLENNKPQLIFGVQESSVWSGYDEFEAVEKFEFYWFSQHIFGQKKQNLLGSINKELKKLNRDKRKLEYKLEQLPQIGDRKKLADIVMANLHHLKNVTHAEVFDFYNDKNITVKLPDGLSPQKYAGKLYQKSKKEHIERDNIKQLILSKSIELADKEKLYAKVEQTSNWKDLRKFTPKATNNKIQKIPQFKEFQFFGYQIYVGKNSKNNDELTLKFAKKNDLWLHAKDVPGSHVVIKRKGKETVPKNVVEYAAQLAGKYSKRKNDTLCPVTVTEKKFVRKIKGSPAGSVVVEREDVILAKLN